MQGAVTAVSTPTPTPSSQVRHADRMSCAAAASAEAQQAPPSGAAARAHAAAAVARPAAGRTSGDLAQQDLLRGAPAERHARHVRHLRRRHQQVLARQVLREAQRRAAARHDADLRPPRTTLERLLKKCKFSAYL